MGARTKLNAAHVNGALVIAVIVGIALQSFLAFLVTLAIGVALASLTGGIPPGGIRPDRTRRKN